MTGSSEPPRVIRVITRLNVGGPARHVLLLDKALRLRGFRAELVHGVVGPREGELGPGGEVLSMLRREVAPIDDVRVTSRLVQMFRERRPVIVHTHLAKAGATGRVAALVARVPIRVHTFHGHVLEGYFSRPVERAFVLAERALARVTDALVAVSPIIRDQLLDLGIGRPSQWRIMPLGLELGPLLDLRMDRAAARTRLELPPDGQSVGIVGRLVPIKRVELFLDLAERVARARPGVYFVVAGDGECRARLENRARKMLGDRVRFLGWVHDLPSLYAALDVVVLTSDNEGTPVSLIEASAAARPVVATRVGGVSDVVREGDSGILVPSGSVDALAEGVLRLLSDLNLAERLGRAGRKWVAPRFGADRLVADVIELYGELLRRKGLT